MIVCFTFPFLSFPLPGWYQRKRLNINVSKLIQQPIGFCVQTQLHQKSNQQTMRLVDLVTCLLLISLASACSNKFHPRSSQCTFYFNFTDSENCDGYQFINCTWRQCVENSTKYNQTTCIRYEDKKSTLWEYCSLSCCYGMFPNKYSSLQECEDHLTKISDITGLIIVSILVFGIIALGINFLFQKGKKKLKECWANSNLFNKRNGEIARSLNDNFLAESTIHIEWKQGHNIKDKKCGVCGKDDCTVRLKCKHWYHRFCAREPIVFQGKCRVCLVECSQSIKIYCRNCKISYYKVSRQEFKDSNDQVCQNCQHTVNPS